MAELRRSGAVRVAELTASLGVSEMTIRRDLEQLSADGHAHKVHGGAVLADPVTTEPGFEAKRTVELPAKTAIAEKAASMVEPGTAISLSAGTTTWTMARLLGDVPGLSVVTNSTTVADTIAAEGGQTAVILTGGVRTPSAALVGPIADIAIEMLHVDQLFLGVHGMDAKAGYTTPNLAEANTNRTLIARARRVVVVADSTKWGSVGLASFGALGAADVVITDDRLPRSARQALDDAVGELIVVPAGAS